MKELELKVGEQYEVRGTCSGCQAMTFRGTLIGKGDAQASYCLMVREDTGQVEYTPTAFVVREGEGA